MSSVSHTSFFRSPWFHAAKSLQAAKEQRLSAQQPWAAGRTELALRAWETAERMRPCAEVLTFPAALIWGQWEVNASGQPAVGRSGPLKDLRLHGLLRPVLQAVDAALSRVYTGIAQSVHKLGCMLGISQGCAPRPVDLKLTAGIGQFVGTLLCRGVDATLLGVGLGLGGAYGLVSAARVAGAASLRKRHAYQQLTAGLEETHRDSLRTYLPSSPSECDGFVIEIARCIDPSDSFIARTAMLTYLVGLPPTMRRHFVELQQSSEGRWLIKHWMDLTPEKVTALLALSRSQRNALLSAVAVAARLGRASDETIPSVSRQAASLAVSLLSLSPAERQVFCLLIDDLAARGFPFASVCTVVQALRGRSHSRTDVARGALSLVRPSMDLPTLSAVIASLRSRACRLVAALAQEFVVSGLPDADIAATVGLLQGIVDRTPARRRGPLKILVKNLAARNAPMEEVRRRCSALAQGRRCNHDGAHGTRPNTLSPAHRVGLMRWGR